MTAHKVKIKGLVNGKLSDRQIAKIKHDMSMHYYRVMSGYHIEKSSDRKCFILMHELQVIIEGSWKEVTKKLFELLPTRYVVTRRLNGLPGYNIRDQHHLIMVLPKDKPL